MVWRCGWGEVVKLRGWLGDLAWVMAIDGMKELFG